MLAGSKKLHRRCSAICKFIICNAENFLTGTGVPSLPTGFFSFNAFQLCHKLSFMLLLRLAFLAIPNTFYLRGAMALEI